MTARLVMDAPSPYLDRGEVPGVVVGVWRDGEVSLDAAGVTAPGGSTPMTADTLTRISSNTKPMAVADNPAPAAKAAGRVPVVALSSLSAPSGAHKG